MKKVSEVMESMRYRSGASPRLRVGIDCSRGERNGPGAVQSFKAECDVNGIMAKYQRTGVISWLAKREGEYLDVTGVDFQSAMDTVLKAQEMFAELPSSVRDRFRNSPAELLTFLHNPENRDEAIELGLVKRPDAPTPPIVVRIAPDEAK